MEDFDIKKKVAEIPVEEVEGFFHDINLEEQEAAKSEQPLQTEESEELEKGILGNFL